jgi:hypothetical protein
MRELVAEHYLSADPAPMLSLPICTLVMASFFGTFRRTSVRRWSTAGCASARCSVCRWPRRRVRRRMLAFVNAWDEFLPPDVVNVSMHAVGRHHALQGSSRFRGPSFRPRSSSRWLICTHRLFQERVVSGLGGRGQD